MAKIDKDFVNALGSFTDSLESIVDLLKSSVENKDTDASDNLSKGLNVELLNSITTEVKKAIEESESIKEIKADVNTIKKSAENKKQDTLIGNVGETKNKKKIVEGVQAIILIAGGVLAIGAAFKIIGKVDFLSVTALSIAMVAMAHTYSKIGEMKDLSYKKVAMISGVMLIMAAAITASSYLLNMVDPIGLMQFITIIGVGVTLSASIALILWGLRDTELDDKAIGNLMLLPVLMPIVAGAIVASSYILSAVAPMSFDTFVNVILASIAMAPAAMIVILLAKMLKGGSFEGDSLNEYDKSGKLSKVLKSGKSGGEIKPADIMKTVAVLPLIAVGIVASSWILQATATIKNPMDVILTGVVIGVVTLAMIPTIIFLTKSKLKTKQVIDGSLAIVIISAAMMASSWLISLGSYSNSPDPEWALGVGLSLVFFGGAVIALGLVMMTGIGFPVLALGALATLVVAGTVALASHILASGSYGNYPTPDWSLGVGISLLSFGVPMVMLGAFVFFSFGLGLGMLAAGGAAMLVVAQTIASASHILASGSYGKYPTEEWATGVAIAIGAYVNAMETVLGMGSWSLFGGFSIDTDDFTNFISVVSEALVTSANLFNSGGGVFDDSKVPSKKWAEGVGMSLVAFSSTIAALDDVDDDLWEDGADKFKKVVKGMSTALVVAAEEFNKIPAGTVFNDAHVPSKKWADGVGGSLASFSTALAAMDEFTDAESESQLEDAIVGIAKALIQAGKQFDTPGLFKLENAPSKKWADGVGGAMMAFAKALTAMDEFLDAESESEMMEAIEGIAKAIRWASFQIDKGKYDIFPNEPWVTGVSKALIGFSEGIATMRDNGVSPSYMAMVLPDLGYAINEMSEEMSDMSMSSPDKLHKLGDALKNFVLAVPDNMTKISFSIVMLSRSLSMLSESLNDLESKSVSNFSKLSGSLLTISVIDHESLSHTLSVINKKGEELKAIADEGNSSIFSDMIEFMGNPGGSMSDIFRGNDDNKLKPKLPMEEMLVHVKNIDGNISKMLENNTTETEEEPEEELRKPQSTVVPGYLGGSV